jgi:hypothetical protein
MKRPLYIAAGVLVSVLLVGISIRLYTAPYMQIVHRQHQAFDAAYREYSSAILARDYAKAYAFGGRTFEMLYRKPNLRRINNRSKANGGNLIPQALRTSVLMGMAIQWSGKQNYKSFAITETAMCTCSMNFT